MAVVAHAPGALRGDHGQAGGAITAAPVHQAYRFALDPTPRQQRALASAVGGARFVYNWGLELVKGRLDERAAGHDVQVPWTLPALRREWNRIKDQVAPWWADNSKEAYSSGLDGLARALKNFSASRHGHRKGRPVGFPRFKHRGRRDTCRFTTGAIRVLPDANTSSSRGSGSSRLMNQPASSPATSSVAAAAFWRPPSPAPPTAGMSPLPARSPGRSPPPTSTRARWEWMSGSGTWQCCPPENRYPTRVPSSMYSASASASNAGGVDRNASGSALGDRIRVAASIEPADSSL